MHIIEVGNNEQNAVSYEGLVTLEQQVQQAIQAGQPIILQARQQGRFFCAGFDLAELEPLERGLVAAHFCRFLHLLRTLFLAPVPVFCWAQGHAVGVGAALCLVADQAVMAPKAKFRFPEAHLGLGQFADIIALLHYRLATPAQAEVIALQSQAITALQAQQWGLVHDLQHHSTQVHTAFQHYLEHYWSPAYAEVKALCREAQFRYSLAEQTERFMHHWAAFIARQR